MQEEIADRVIELLIGHMDELCIGDPAMLATDVGPAIDAEARLSGAGNIYVNRNMIGAVVGVQPFGGRGLSGTGPKAGGPHYLLRFGSEYTVSNNIAAVGGNASLLSLRHE